MTLETKSVNWAHLVRYDFEECLDVEGRLMAKSTAFTVH
jgi:hypothetical protein